MSKFRQDPPSIQPAEGRLGVLLVGLGAVSTTLIAGVSLMRRHGKSPVGALTQIGRLRLGRRDRRRMVPIRELVPLAGLNDLVFGAWDVLPDNGLQAARVAGVLSDEHLRLAADELEAVEPMKGVFFPDYVRRLEGTHVKEAPGKWALACEVREDIRRFKEENGCERLVIVWCASTEIHALPTEAHASVESFEAALKESAPSIAPSQIYAYAALQEGVPFANGAPNLGVEIPALYALADRRRVPVAGKDFKTGQTLMKTIIAPGLQARLLGLRGWFSTNILGNRDGEILDDPESFRSKEVSKLGVLEALLDPEAYPQLYGDVYHKVRINYYPPRGDEKEGWDNIDLFGWLGYPMQIKVDFLCRDSILAAPIVLDLALFMDLASRAGMYGTQEWLSFYFKSPMTRPGLPAEHDLFAQLSKLHNTLRHIAGEELITHLGLDYYAEEGA